MERLSSWDACTHARAATGPDLLVAMVKALAIAKYGLTAVDKMYQVAHKHHDSASVAYALDRAYQDVRCLSISLLRRQRQLPAAPRVLRAGTLHASCAWVKAAGTSCCPFPCCDG